MTAEVARTLRLGTRRSELALAQSRWVARRLEEAHPGVAVEIVAMSTFGDRTPGDLAKVGGKGLFTQELEEQLLDGRLDLAVHSLKDLPVELPAGLTVAAFPERDDPRDALISEGAPVLDGLPEGARVLTGSLRRKAGLLVRRPDLRVIPVRGNVQTRLHKWREGQGDAVVLAAAGLRRLGIAGDLPAHFLTPGELLPAPGQGTLAVEVLEGSAAHELAAALDHPPTARAARAERAVVRAFGGDCTLPLGAWARAEPDEARDGGMLALSAFLALPDGSDAARGEGRGGSEEEAAEACIEAMHQDGAGAILKKLRP